MHVTRKPAACTRRRTGAALALFVAAGLLAPASVASADPDRGASAASVVRAPASAKAAKPGKLSVTPAKPAPGDRVTLRTKVAKPGKRVVRLQVQAKGRWRTVATKRTKRGGKVAFKRKVQTATAFRVVAPRVAGRKARAPRWTSARTVVRPRKIAAVVDLQGDVLLTEDRDAALAAVLRPAVAGRQIRFQRYSDGSWRTVADLTDTGARRLVLPGLRLPVGDHRVRVVAEATQRTRRVVEERTVTVVPVETPPTIGHGPYVVGALPVVEVTTPEGQEIRSKTDYVRVDLKVDGRSTSTVGGDALPSHDLSARLRVRGNSTSWVMDKLPYKVKLDSRTSLLGMPASKDFVLLANFYDRSLMRNTAAFEAARVIGVPWSPRMFDVNLYVNGTYRGVYQLGEGIEVEPGRVDLGADDLPETPDDGGFLIEADHWDDTDPRFRTEKGIQFYLKESGADDAAYLSSLAGQMQEFEDVLYSDDFLDPEVGYRSYVDLRSFADWFLVHELTKSTEANFSTSVWMQRSVGGRLAMGPPWDFDQSAGMHRVYGIEDPEGWFVHRGPLKPGVSRAVGMVRGGPHWIQRMLEDPEFRALVQQRWAESSDDLQEMVSVLERHGDRLEESADRNFAPKPKGAGLPLGPSMLDNEFTILDLASWREHGEWVTEWYERRIAWLDRAIPTLGSSTLP